ncbi:MAG TPA: hypothetical protein VG738_15515 [Chitinophagaceae bacterium]|nr:hypothetical protein [Chitinophagaceae bacterium]
MKAIARIAMVGLLAISTVCYAEGSKKDCKGCTQKKCTTECQHVCGKTSCKKSCSDSTSTATTPQCANPTCGMKKS